MPAAEVRSVFDQLTLEYPPACDQDRPLAITVVFVPTRGTNEILVLRQLLKFAGRQLGLKCTNVAIKEQR